MYLLTFMHETGNPAAVTLNNDYSSSPVYGIIQPPEDEVWALVTVSIIVASASKLKPGDFGDITGGLSNGLQFELADDDDVYLPLGAGPITQNKQFFYLSSRIDITSTVFDVTTYTYNVTCDFVQKGEALVLDGEENQRFQVHLQDDLSDLDNFTIIGSGMRAVHGTRSVGMLNDMYILPMRNHGN